MKNNPFAITGYKSPEYFCDREIESKTLRAIALEGTVENPTSGSFLAAHQLGAASSVSLAVSSLTKKELIHNESGKLTVQDKFFSQWIRTK